MKKHTAITFLALSMAATGAFAQPRYLAELGLNGAGGCVEQPPGLISVDDDSPVQNSYGPTVHCDSFWGESIGSASARAAQGVVGIDLEHTWDGCDGFGCGPAGSLIDASASHEFDVIFTSPTNDPITVRMNLAISGNIQEMTAQYRRVIVSVDGAGSRYTGAFWQIVGDTIRQGILGSFVENSYHRFSVGSFTVPTNTPVRFALGMYSDQNGAYTEGGAINFMQGMRLDSTLTGSVFTIVETVTGVDPGEIGVDSIGANITGNRYAGDDQSCIGDRTTSGATIERQEGYGVPDGIADLDDLGYLLIAWQAGEFSADLTTTSATVEGQIGFGVPDGVVDVDDLGYFLNSWLAGCQ